MLGKRNNAIATSKQLFQFFPITSGKDVLLNRQVREHSCFHTDDEENYFCKYFLALANPTWDVFLLFASPVGFINNTVKAPIIRALESYQNVNLRNVNLWSYAHGTPISSFINNGQLFRSKYLNSHTSDFLRYLR